MDMTYEELLDEFERAKRVFCDEIPNSQMNLKLFGEEL